MRLSLLVTYRRKGEGQAEEAEEGEEDDGGCSKMSSIQNHTEAVIVWGRTRGGGSSCIHLADQECDGCSGRYKLPIDITRTGHPPACDEWFRSFATSILSVLISHRSQL
jgi:hypothetical protein